MKNIFILLASLLFFSDALSQSRHRNDSLRRQLVNKKGTARFDLLNVIAWGYRFSNQDSTIYFAQQAYDLGKKLSLTKGLAKPLNYIGVAHEYKGEAIEAYDSYSKALTLATQQNDAIEVAYANNNSGRLFFDQGNVQRSQECYQNALKIFENLHDSSGLAYVYLSLAKLYQYQKNYSKAEEFFTKVYQTRLKMLGNPNISALLHLGIFYREFGKFERSNLFFLKADSLCKRRGDEVTQAEANLELAENFLKEGSPNDAYAYSKNGLALAIKNNLSRELDRGQLLIGKALYSLNDFPKAKRYFEAITESRRLFREPKIKMEAYYYLGQIYGRQVGQDMNKLANHNQYLTLKDSLKEVDLTKQINRLKFQFQMELEQKKKENTLLRTIESKNNTIIKKQQVINIVYGVVLIIIVGITFALYRNVRLKQSHNIELAMKQEKILKQTDELKLKNAEIERVNSNLEVLVDERTNIIREQHQRLIDYAYFNAHQIRGPLARILGLISVINLEYQGSYGPYIKMLDQAGNDLDSAIKKVNDLLNEG
ncbi:MAG: tetratricopeptide repeat protein [Cyclobacteriaceae bacterium]